MAVTAPGDAHVHPDAARLLGADDAQRIEAVRQKRWIAHDPACRVLSSLQEVFEQPRSDRMESLLLTGESGIGKTMLLKKFGRSHASREPLDDGTLRYPVVVVLMPESPTEEAVLLQMLKAVGAPISFTRRARLIALRETVFRILRQVEARIVAIDEINSVLVGTAREQRLFLQLLRFLSNELSVAIVCAGVPEARHAVFSDPQLRGRMSHVELRSWSIGPELQAFINMLVQSFPLRRPSPVESVRVQRLLVERSGGLTLTICRALERAAVAAIRSGEERVDLGLLDRPETWEGLAPVAAYPRRVKVAGARPAANLW